MANCLVGCVLLYMFALVMTQTTLGQGLSNLRWISLGVVSLTGVFFWLAARRRSADGDLATIALAIYLACTGISVVFAEDWFFSLFRWGTHALMVFVLYLFLREVVSLSQVVGITWAAKVGLGVAVPLLLFESGLLSTADTSSLHRTSFINANTLGHFSAVAGLLFIHGAATSRSFILRNVQALAAIVSFMTIWHSGARSSFVAASVGVLLLTRYYRGFFSGWVIVGLAVLFLAGIVAPSVSTEIESFVVKDKGKELALTPANIVRTRTNVWQDSWNGFKARPMFGWGFGAHEGIEGNWRLSGSALGYTSRDLVNDTLFILESTGLVGLVGFLVLVVSFLRHRPPRVSGIDSSPAIKALYDYNVLYSVLLVSLLCLFQFDDTGLSAGNLPSALLWLSAGLAAAMRSELFRVCPVSSAAITDSGKST